MATHLTKTIAGQTLALFAQRALLWQEARLLVVADAHLGKAQVLRRQGVPMPTGTTAGDLARLSALIRRWDPQTLLFLGDLLHGPMGSGERFAKQIRRWRRRHARTRLMLVSGNHDRAAAAQLQHFELDGQTQVHIQGPFRFTHQPVAAEDDRYGIAGHLHPAVSLRGPGRQRETLACFCFGRRRALLPAFGNTTGRYILRPQPGDAIAAIAGDAIVDVTPGGQTAG
ncbi:MAG: ligase-associated DNA damage response endonuclease PdeM [Desulfosarcinaceae bacterium]|nr:ligase-associated DNA damage response endonuclease PdeM [Desulfosarcinaceae bacterium]